MTDQLIAAFEYLDAHTKVVLQKPKYRILGDIDGKYNVIDPYFDFPEVSPFAKEVTLAGTTKINPSNAISAVDVVEIDREKMVESSRAKSAPGPTNGRLLDKGYSRSLTSLSWAKDVYRDDDFSIPGSKSAISASHTSIKRLTFTPPGVSVGPSDAKDEVMVEIVNKPLVSKQNIVKSQSAPPSGRLGTRSFALSSKRAKTAYGRRRRSAKTWEKKPGPFITVKVTGQDLWVVSNSTPNSFFKSKRDDGLRLNSVKMARWQETADKVPKVEQDSPSIQDRKLGAPAQFTPTIEWLKYNPADRQKKPPVLKSFIENDSGKYYNVESNLTKKVSQHMMASPGVRIARNGEVLSHSMLVDGDDKEAGSDSDESLGEEIDIISLLPVKLGEKVVQIKKEDDALEKLNLDINGEFHDEDPSMKLTERSNISPNNERLTKKYDTTESEESSDDDDKISVQEEENVDKVNLEYDSHEKLHEDATVSKQEDNTEKFESHSRLTAEMLAKISGGDVKSNPLLQSTDVSSISQTTSSLDSLNFQINFQEGDQNSEEEAVWKLMESANPGIWLNKKKFDQHKLSKQLKVYRKHETNTNNSKCQEKGNTVVPLTWTDEMSKSGTKVVNPKTYFHSIEEKLASQSRSNSVVMYKSASTPQQSTPTSEALSSRPQSASFFNCTGVFNEVGGSTPSRGYRAPVSTPRSAGSARSKSASSSSSADSRSQKSLRPLDFMRHGLELANLLNVTPDSFPRKPQNTNHSISKEKVKIVYDELSSSQKDASDEVKAPEQTSKKTIDLIPNKKHVRVDDPQIRNIRSAPGARISFIGEKKTNAKSEASSNISVDLKPSHSAMVRVLPLNLSGLDEHLPTKTNPSHSRRGNANVISMQPPRQDIGYLSSFRTPAPNNSPKSPYNFLRKTLNIENNFESDEEPQTGMQINNVQSPTMKQSLLARPKNGFAPSSLTRPQSVIGSERHKLGLAGSSHNGIKHSLSEPFGESRHSSESSMFIQITQPLNIASKLGQPSNNTPVAPPTGNKMYDSYMHELSNANEQAKSFITARSLGGTSGKIGNNTITINRASKKFIIHRAIEGSNRIQQARPATADNSSFGFGIKGDQVRLNLDKNIGVIVRDLELLKKTKKTENRENTSSLPGSHQDESSRKGSPDMFSNKHSGDGDTIAIQSDRETGVVKGIPAMIPTNSVEVHDTATQWSARTDSGIDKFTYENTNEQAEVIEVDRKEENAVNTQFLPSKDSSSNNMPLTSFTKTMASTTEKIQKPLSPHRRKPVMPAITMIDEEDEDEMTEDDDKDVKGVTKVTVNIGSSQP